MGRRGYIWIFVATLLMHEYPATADRPERLPRIQLDRERSNSYVYIDKDTALEYTARKGGAKWEFRSADENPIYLYFTPKYHLEFISVKGACYSSISVEDLSGIDRYYCKTPQRVYNGTAILVSSRNHPFEAIVAKRQLVPGICDFGTGNIGENSPFVVYRVNSKLREEDYHIRSVDFNDDVMSGVVSTKMMLFGNSRGLTPCTDPNNIILPTSEVPSCHADFHERCHWSTNAPLENSESLNTNTNVTGSVFVLNLTRVEFSTKSPHQLDTICFQVEYLSYEAVQLDVSLQKGSSGSKELLSTTILKPTTSWAVERIEAELPESLAGTPSQMEIAVNGSTTRPGLVKKIYGCNANERVERFNVVDPFGNPIVLVNYKTEDLVKDKRCQNGGEMGSKGCICPVGFIGSYCEIGCGKNSFGPNCEGKCSYDGNGCSNMVFCPHNLGCNCAPGWKGKNCDKRCSTDEYGPGCTEDCGNCRGSESCDPYTGSCRNGCKSGYAPPLCKTKYVHVNKPPTITDAQYNSAVMRFSINRENISGEGDPMFYRITYEEIDSEVTTTSLRAIPPDGNIVKRFGPLNAGKMYNAKLIIYDSTMMSYAGDDLPVATFQTPCSETELYITVQHVGQSSVSLDWEVVEKENGCDFGAYEVQIRMGSEWMTSGTDDNQITFGNLLPGLEYRIRVRQFDNQFPQPYFYTKFVTQYETVTGVVRDLRILNTGQRSATLSWRTEHDNNLGYSIKYMCLVNFEDEAEDCSGDKGELSTDNKLITIKNLHPFRLYEFLVKQKPGHSGYSTVLGGTKEAEPEAPRDFTMVNKTQTSCAVIFRRPEKANGILREFLISIIESETCIDQSSECTTNHIHLPVEDPDKDLFQLEIDKPSKSINVTLRARTTHWGKEAGPIVFNVNWQNTDNSTENIENISTANTTIKEPENDEM